MVATHQKQNAVDRIAMERIHSRFTFSVSAIRFDEKPLLTVSEWARVWARKWAFAYVFVARNLFACTNKRTKQATISFACRHKI